MYVKPYSEEWWFRRDVRNLLRKISKFAVCDERRGGEIKR